MSSKKAGEPTYFRDKSLAMEEGYTKNDLPLKIRRGENDIDLMSINQIIKGIDAHSFSKEELEHIAKTMAMRISVFMDNRFVCY